jgi:hypothetical protein
MAQMEGSAHAETIEYYRLTLEARKRDPHAERAARIDAETLEMVRETPDLLEMNKAFMEGGLAFRLTRAIAVDGALYQAAIHRKLGQEELAEHWERRAKALESVEDYAAVDGIAEEWGKEEGALRERDERFKIIVDEGLEAVLNLSAGEPGSKLGELQRTKLEANLKELRERAPGMRFPDLLTLPFVRDRLPWDDAALRKLSELFEGVNRDEFGGEY